MKLLVIEFSVLNDSYGDNIFVDEFIMVISRDKVSKKFFRFFLEKFNK